MKITHGNKNVKLCICLYACLEYEIMVNITVLNNRVEHYELKHDFVWPSH